MVICCDDGAVVMVVDPEADGTKSLARTETRALGCCGSTSVQARARRSTRPKGVFPRLALTSQNIKSRPWSPSSAFTSMRYHQHQHHP